MCYINPSADLCGGEAMPQDIPLICALGVGINRNDDIDQSVIIKNQLSLAAEQGFGLYFPAGRYRVDNGIVLSSHEKIVGSRSGATIFYSSMNVAAIVGEETYTLPVTNVVISDVIFDNVVVRLYGNRKHNIQIIYNAFINSRTAANQPQVFVAHTPYLVKGNVFMRGKYYPGIGISSYRNVDTEISYNFIGSLSDKGVVGAYIDFRTHSLLDRLWAAKQNGKIILDDDQGNYVSGWYATDGLTRSRFFRNVISGNTLQNLYNNNTGAYDIVRDHILYIKQYDDVYVYQNYFSGWPEDAHGQVKFRNAQNLVFAGNYLNNTSFDARPYDDTPHLYMRNTYIFNNFIYKGRISYWQNFDDAENINIDVVDYLVFNNTFLASDKSTPRITATYRNLSNNFFYTFSSNLYTDGTTAVISTYFINITLDSIKAKIPESKRQFFDISYILPVARRA